MPYGLKELFHSCMRKILFLLIIIILSACNRSPEKAGEYHQFMIESQSALMNRVFELSRNLRNMDSTKANQILEETKVLALNTAEEIRQAQPFKKDTTLRHATLQVVEAYAEVINNELGEMAGMVTRGELTDSTGFRKAAKIRLSILHKLIKAEKEFARQEGKFRRTYLAGKDFIEADTTFFGVDTINPAGSEF